MAGTMNNYYKEKRALEDAFVNKMLLDYDIREVTTRRQAKNDTITSFGHPWTWFLH